jgi:hypothetical protein
MLKTIAINISELLTASASTFAGAKFIEYKRKKEGLVELNTEHQKREKRLKNQYTQELGVKEEQLCDLEARLLIFEMDENERLKEFKRQETEKLHKQAQSVLQKHLEASTAKLNNFLTSLSDRLIAAELIMTDMEAELKNLENSKKKQRALEELAVKVVADDVDALGRNFCSMDALKKEFNSLTPLLRHYSTQRTSEFSLFKYLMSSWLSKTMFIDAPVSKNDIFYCIQSALDSGQLILALRLYQSIQGWPRLILREWSDHCYTRLECIQEIQANMYLNKL